MPNDFFNPTIVTKIHFICIVTFTIFHGNKHLNIPSHILVNNAVFILNSIILQHIQDRNFCISNIVIAHNNTSKDYS